MTMATRASTSQAATTTRLHLAVDPTSAQRKTTTGRLRDCGFLVVRARVSKCWNIVCHRARLYVFVALSMSFIILLQYYIEISRGISTPAESCWEPRGAEKVNETPVVAADKKLTHTNKHPKSRTRSSESTRSRGAARIYHHGNNNNNNDTSAKLARACVYSLLNLTLSHGLWGRPHSISHTLRRTCGGLLLVVSARMLFYRQIFA